MPVDYHMHLVGDDEPHDDACFTVEHIARYVEAARAAGVAEIGFTEHVYRYTVARDWLDAPLWRAEGVADIERYARAVRAAADAGLPVRLGLELDWVPGRESELRSLAAAHPWDYLLGSYHWIGTREIDHAANSAWDGADPDAMWRTYVDGFCAAARSGIYDSMAHPDLAKVFGYRPEPEPLDLYAEMAEAAADGEVCVEVSTAGLRRVLGELYPGPRLLAAFAARGVAVTLGSDAHAPEGVGRGFPVALAALRQAGYRELTAFDRRRRRAVPLP